MKSDVYKQMFEVMKTRRGPYTGIDIPEFYTLVQELFTPEEAQVNNAMSRKPSTAGDIAKVLGKPDDDVPQVNLDRCFGCAVCATGCPTDAILMVAKSDFSPPPKNPKELITALKASFTAQV